MRPIRVPKTPKKAFNPNRRPSALLLGQVAHLEWASRPAAQRKPHQMKKIIKKGKPKTEAAAAERIAALTKIVLENASADRQRQLVAALPVAEQAAAVKSFSPSVRARTKRSKKTARRRKRRRS